MLLVKTTERRFHRVMATRGLPRNMSDLLHLRTYPEVILQIDVRWYGRAKKRPAHAQRPLAESSHKRSDADKREGGFPSKVWMEVFRVYEISTRVQARVGHDRWIDLDRIIDRFQIRNQHLNYIHNNVSLPNFYPLFSGDESEHSRLPIPDFE